MTDKTEGALRFFFAGDEHRQDLNIHGETMAEYYQRRTREHGDEIERMKEILMQALDYLNGETPEDCTREEAREDTIQKIKDVLNGR